MNSLNSKTLKELENELEKPLFSFKNYYILTENYIVNEDNEFYIINYYDIILAYEKNRMTKGRIKTVIGELIFFTKENRKYRIVIEKGLIPIYINNTKIKDFIFLRNPNILFGYNKENINIIKGKYGFEINKKTKFS